MQRILCIWLPHLMADEKERLEPELKTEPFVLTVHEQNRRVVKVVSREARRKGISPQRVLTDCKAIWPALQAFEYEEEEAFRVLKKLADYCICYTPSVALLGNDGLLLDIAGCTHLWTTEQNYLQQLAKNLYAKGYFLRCAIADTIGTAWALCHFGKNGSIVASGQEAKALAPLPPAALRLDAAVVEKFSRLGFTTIGSFLQLPGTALRRRFGQHLLNNLHKALGQQLEVISPIKEHIPYQQRLPALDPVRSPEGIQQAMKQLLEALCKRLQTENKGLRRARLLCYRIDGDLQELEIGTGKASRNVAHLFQLFALQTSQIRPELGIELFLLEATVVEDLPDAQDALWHLSQADESLVAELLDRISGKVGEKAIHRYLPDEHYWPERNIREAQHIQDVALSSWRSDLPRPAHLLPQPEPIETVVRIPDYPPLIFIYKGISHLVKKADGPERIEQEWWLQQGLYRDYYCVEDERGARYWLFRSGDNHDGDAKWFLHGFFA